LKSKLGISQGSKLVGKVLLGLSLLLGILLLVSYLMRNTLTSAVLNHLGQEQQLSVNCLSLDFDWHFNVKVHELCIETPDVSIQLNNGQWLRDKNDIVVSELQLTHRNNPARSTNTTEPSFSTDFQLPQNLPSIAIQTLTISSPLLSRELKLGLILDHAATLTISGDLEASLQQKEQHWQAEVKWSLADLLRTLPAAQTLQQQHAPWLNDEVAGNTRFISRIDFDGKNLIAVHDVDLDTTLTLPQCNLALKMVGKIDTRIANPLLIKNIHLDLSALQTSFDLSSCELVPEILASWQLKRFNLLIPQPINVDFQQLNIPELHLLGLNPAAQQELLLNDIHYEFSGAIAAAFKLHVAQPINTFNLNVGQLALNSTGRISAQLAADLQWNLQDAQVQLSLQNVSNAQLSLQQVQADLSLHASHNNGAQLSGKLEATTFSGFDLTLAKMSSNVDLSLHANQQLQLKLKNNLNTLSYQQFNLAQVDNQLVFNGKLLDKPTELSLNSLSQINLNAETSVTKLHSPDVTVAMLNNQLNVVGKDLDNLEFSSKSQLDNNQVAGIKLGKLNNQLSGKLIKLANINFSGQTDMNGLAIDKAGQQLKVKTVTVKHKGRSALSLDSTFSEHNILLEKDFAANLIQQQQQVSLQIEQQNITSLQPLVSQLSPQLTLTQGRLNAKMTGNLEQQTLAADVSLSEVNGRYTDYLFSGVSFHSPLSFDSAGLQLGVSTLQVDLLNMGLPMEAITASLLSVEGVLKLENILGNTLGGQFSVKDIWLDQRKQHFDVVIKNIDLAQVVALQDQPGISITGQIGGKLPVNSDLQAVSIDNGKVDSQGGGVLTIRGNPAFDSIKKQQSELAFLENYHFSQLGSKVTLTSDGWLFLELAFKGQNPDKKQAVNFNYSHQENLLTLLETLRVTNSIQEKIEKSISKGGQQ